MDKNELKVCPRCNTRFKCNGASIESCQCNNINLALKLRKQLTTQYSDCLCGRCLRILAKESA